MAEMDVTVLNIGRCEVCGGTTTNGVCDTCGWCVVCCVCGKVRQIDGTWMKVDGMKSTEQSHTLCPRHFQFEYFKAHLRLIPKFFRRIMQ